MLKRAFFTLYLLVVVAILLAGWGLDRLQQTLTNESVLGTTDNAFFQLLASHAQLLPAHQRQEYLADELNKLGISGHVYGLADLASTGLAEELATGEPLALNTDDGRELYVKLADLPFIVRIKLAEESQAWQRLLLVAFYLFLAVVIYLWVWPLVRDLKSLEAQARRFGRNDSQGIALNPGSPVYLLACEFNRMQQRIDELLASYREMTYAVSHELRTPLARMKFALELAESAPNDESCQRQLASVRQDVADMDDLINQLLSYAGFESQTQSLVQRPGAAGAMAALVEQQVRRLHEQNPQIHFHVIDSLGDSELYCEWHLFERILQNLLGNARRYAQQNVRVELYREGEEYVVAVEDDGKGVDPADRDKIFDSFVRLKQQPGKDCKGFGLGLAIVRRIMGWHNGQVHIVDAHHLAGARFECRWPIAHLSD
ncbi:ATP-binding protein [Gilvimarinus sp. 1_MG-2023]|uniref:ATP-binding protein n=1 Tax=Gilvimarinus sp. 1_MG-2023 TaxID=3062638 RepID=UPI0026E1AF78|nr:ATP-binding protein [Gilvimarinus sp. 1_MG-2023]MDO6747237.1 ATP-binding protein [Gilvimarinus sp. 1_MG-2023]